MFLGANRVVHQTNQVVHTTLKGPSENTVSYKEKTWDTAPSLSPWTVHPKIVDSVETLFGAPEATTSSLRFLVKCTIEIILCAKTTLDYQAHECY